MRDIHPQPFAAYSDLVGVPYSRMNCLELVIAFYKKVMDRELQYSYAGSLDDTEAMWNMFTTNQGDLEEVKTPAFGDIIIIRIGGLESHIGVYLDEGLMLHSIKVPGYSMIDRVARWKSLITGYYRVKENTT